MYILCITLCAFSGLSAAQEGVKEIAPEVVVLLEQKKFLKTSAYMQHEVQKFFFTIKFEKNIYPTRHLERKSKKLTPPAAPSFCKNSVCKGICSECALSPK